MTSTTTTASGLRLRSAGASRGAAIAVAALTALALLLRVTSLSRSLFTDEVYSLALAQRSLAHMIGLFGYEANGMAYPLVLWPLIRILELQSDPRDGAAVAWARRHCHVQTRQSVGVWALHATGCTGMVSSRAERTRI